MQATEMDRALAGLAVIDGDDAAAVDAPRNLVLVLAGRHAGVAFDATVGVAKEFDAGHWCDPPLNQAAVSALIWQSVTFVSCMKVTGS